MVLVRTSSLSKLIPYSVQTYGSCGSFIVKGTRLLSFALTAFDSI